MSFSLMNRLIVYGFIVCFLSIFSSDSVSNKVMTTNNTWLPEGSVYLLKPKSRYFVSFFDKHVINDSACPNKFYSIRTRDMFSASNKKYCNEVWVRVYYPTLKQSFSGYYPVPSLISDIRSFGYNPTKKEIKEIESIKSYSAPDLPIAPGHFPVIFFSPGYGIPAQEYENIIVSLVSYGYVVVAVNSQFINGSFKLDDGAIVSMIVPENDKQKKYLFENSLSDLKFIFDLSKKSNFLNKLSGHINWAKIGLLGHSLGAATVAHFASYNGVDAIVSLDLTIDLLYNSKCHLPIKKPYLHLFSSQMYAQNRSSNFPYLCESDRARHGEEIVVISNDKVGDIYSMHLNFTDYSTLQYQPVIHSALLEYNKVPAQRFLGKGKGVFIAKSINRKLVHFFNHAFN